MRVSNSMIWGSVISSTNKALSDYYALSEQNSTMKKVNSPSDDASATGSLLNLRDSLSALEQYQENIDTAAGYLSSADDALTTMSDLITYVMELAEQGATGTLSEAQRESLGEQVVEYYEEMISVANTEFMDDSIFAGQQTDVDTYAMGLGADVTSGTMTEADILTITGDTDHVYQVEFLGADTVGATASGDVDYQYSTDGGETWTIATLAMGDTTLDFGGVQVELADGTVVSDESDAAGASAFVIRPAAIYQGDDADGAEVMQYGSSSLTIEAEGSFSSKIAVRIDTGGDVTTDTIEYSYSTDGGSTWVEGNQADDGLLTVPGGTLSLQPDGGTTVAAGEQFVISPHTADIELSITDSSTITINNVGKDIFGGLYQAPGEDYATAEDEPNLFETVGELVGALSTNDQDAIAACLEKLSNAQEVVTSAAADVGAREQRLTAAEYTLEIRSGNQTSQLSDIEDVDIITLSVQLEAAEAVYTSVVETSTNIMQLSLINYI
ncbi:flagellin [Desulfovibrio ferrophilus]|uniref:Flagellar hook-associated protein 3 n=1 Tax=Desulfovibrio ferrophilus TaxID=241368 RepID=A0A2Z6AWT0_9BACT|nr:flagellin [Desulfovibrio ferrophilus]BBD07665.1 flagellar hook-associated protein 3 [Desulfovibrio ferrophilus]